MEFDKKTKVEEVEHANSEAPKKLKKKKASKEKKTGTTITKRIKAPVPAEILAEEAKKSDEEKPKTKKTRKKSKKATSPGNATASETKNNKSEVDIVDHAEMEDLPKATAQKETKDIKVPKITKETTNSKDEHSDEALGENSQDTSPDESFERTILPNDVEEEEGELFISERLRRLIGKDEGGSDNSPEAVNVHARGEERPEQSTTDRSSQITSRRTTVTPASPVVATSPSTEAIQTAGGGFGALPPSSRENFSAPLSPDTAPAAANQAPAAANTALYGNRTAERRNLIAGIIVGGVIEHIRHKRREKRLKATHKKETEKLTKAQQFREAEQHKEMQKTERSKTTLEQQLDRLKQSITPAKSEKPARPNTKEQPTITASTEVSESPNQTEAISPASASFYEDFKRKYRSNEVVATTSKASVKTSEKPAPVPRQQPENIDEPIPVSPDRRVETSAWHRIEVDKKTGKAVENPELSYGEEFQNEQHQEQLRKQIDEVSVNSEDVRQNYMPMIDKTSSTTVQTHDPIPDASNSRKQRLEKISAPSSFNDALQDLRDRAGDNTIVDYALIGILFLIIIAIIALLI